MDATDHTPGRGVTASSGSQVSPRQLEVLRLVARGLSLEDIASVLLLDLPSAQQEAREAITRLGLDTQQDVVAWHRARTAAGDQWPEHRSTTSQRPSTTLTASHGATTENDSGDNMNTISTAHEVDWNTVKAKHRAIWESGDYAVVADDLLPEMGVALVEACSIGPGDQVLDIAAGTGNVALPAAVAGAHVVASDLAPALVAEGERLTQLRGLSIDWRVDDAEDLPYDDGQFDVVTSCLGIMFAPRHEVAAGELLRVTKPGGRIGLVNWTPEGFIGQMFGVMKRFAPAPPPGASPPPAWGDPDRVASLLGDGVRNAAFERRSLGVDQFATATDLRDYLKRNYGPTIAVYASISGDSQQVRALDAALDELISSCMTQAGPAQHMDWEYLLYTAERA